jgi:O-succinylbenzoic acid--CoA ligase
VNHPGPATTSAAVDRVKGWLFAPGPVPDWVVETSGSTGAPKRVRLSREAVRASVTATRERLGHDGGWALALPPAYVAGLMVIARSLLAGTEPLIVSASPEVGVDRPSLDGRAISLVPTQLLRLLDSAGGPAWLRTGALVLLGGGPVPPGMRERAAAAGVRVVATYGASETCGGCVYDGLPLDGVEVSLESDGRVCLAGPMLFSGYDGDPELTATTLVDGRFRTSDLGELDGGGRLRVLGRIDEVIVSGGVNVPGGAVAARLREHPAVAEAEVVGAPDEEWGRRVVACVVPSASAPGLDELRDWVGERLPRAWAPREVVVLEALPRLASGKVDRQALEAAWGR